MIQDDALQYLVVGLGDDVAFLKLAARRFCANGRACVVDGGKFTFARFVERCRAAFDFT